MRSKGIELELKVRDYRLHPNKYNEIPIGISKIIEYLNENEENEEDENTRKKKNTKKRKK